VSRPTFNELLDWQEVPLGELLGLSNGINADKSAYGTGLPFANVLEVITNESITESDIPGRITVSPKVQRRYEVKPGDVLFNRTSETQEEVGLASVYVGNRPIVFGGFVFRGRPLTSKVTLAYSKYAFRSPFVRSQVVARGQGGIHSNIGQRDLKNVTVLLPSPAEQFAIAERLDDVSAMISCLERVIAKKQAIKQGMMQQLLTGKTRLPGFTEPWLEGTFEQLVIPSRERAMPRDVPATTPLVELEQLEGRSGRLIGFSQASEAVSLKTVFKPGDVLFGKLRAYLRKFWYADIAGLCTTEIWVLRARTGVHGRFVRYVVETDQFVDVASGAYGTHMPRSDWGTVRTFPVAIPPHEEQKAIAGVLADTDNEIGLLRQRLAKAHNTKQGMMQELLTGRTRLPVAEGAA
jgi:type I restriction enzyme, S subunit